MAVKIVRYACVIRLITEMLGTVPKNRDVYTKYIADKARQQLEKDAGKDIPLASGDEATSEAIEELLKLEPETIQEVEERGWTGFHDTNGDGTGKFFLYDYHVKGFL